MLRQETLRHYLLGLLSHSEVPQNVDCEMGALWKNCDDTAIDIHDSFTAQVDENAPAKYSESDPHASVVISVPSSQLTLSPTRVEREALTVEIVVTANAPDGHDRQNTLDAITERILYRILSQVTITDVNTDKKYRSFMRWVLKNELVIRLDDEGDFSGNYTIRTIAFTIQTNSCIAKVNCNDVELCFNFDAITTLDKP